MWLGQPFLNTRLQLPHFRPLHDGVWLPLLASIQRAVNIFGSALMQLAQQPNKALLLSPQVLIREFMNSVGLRNLLSQSVHDILI